MTGLLLPHVEPDLSRIYHFLDPRLPQFGFEWHPRTQKVYRIDVPGEWIDGQWVADPRAMMAKGTCIAEHENTHGGAYSAVQTFCRGYLLAVQHRNAGLLATYAPERIISPDTDPCPVR